MAGETSGIDGLANQLDDVGRRGGHEQALATANGRQEGDFIASVERSAPCSELPIARGYQGGAILLQGGVTGSVFGEESFDVGMALQVERVFGAAGDFFQAAKEEDLDADGGRNGRHVTIVTPRTGKQPVALVVRAADSV